MQTVVHPRCHSFPPVTPTPTIRANRFPEVTDLFCQIPLNIFSYQLEDTNLGDLMQLLSQLGKYTLQVLLTQKNNINYTRKNVCTTK